MRTPLTITYPITTKEIEHLARKEKDGRVRQRLWAMKFISQGQSIPQAAQRLDISERPLRKWLQSTGPRGLTGCPPIRSTCQTETETGHAIQTTHTTRGDRNRSGL